MDVQNKRQRRVRRIAILLASMAAVGGTVIMAAPAGAIPNPGENPPGNVLPPGGSCGAVSEHNPNWTGGQMAEIGFAYFDATYRALCIG